MSDVATALLQLISRTEPAADPALAAVKLARASLDALVLRLGQSIDAKVTAQLAGGLTQLTAAGESFVLKLETPLPVNTSVTLKIDPAPNGQPAVTVTVQPPPAAAPPVPPTLQPLPLLPQPVTAAAASPASVPPAAPQPLAFAPPNSAAAIPSAAPLPGPPATAAASPTVPQVPPPPGATLPPGIAAPAAQPAVPAQPAGQPSPLTAQPVPMAPSTAPVVMVTASPSSAPATVPLPPVPVAASAQPAPGPAPLPVPPISNAPPAAPLNPPSTLVPQPAPASTAPSPAPNAPAGPAPTVAPPGPATAALPSSTPQVATPPAATASPPPATPAAASRPAQSLAASPPVVQILADPVQAAARQDSILPLIARLATLAAPTAAALPRPALEAIAMLLSTRLDLNRAPPDGKAIREAVLRAGIVTESGARSPADAKSALLQLRAALSGFIGREVDAIAPVTRRPPPPMKGEPARAPSSQPAPALPEEPVETARQLLGHADAALSRVKLLQLASNSGDAVRPNLAAPAAEFRVEVPMQLGAETGILQLLVERDGKHRRNPAERGWRLRFALNFTTTGEVGAEVALLGRSANVALWAADPATADALEAMLPELGPALARHGLDVGAVRVRRGAPPPASRGPGQLLDSAR